MKGIATTVWWVMLGGLILGLMLCIALYAVRHGVTERQIAELGRSIHADSTQRRGATIDGVDAMLFHKDLTINHWLEATVFKVVLGVAAALAVFAVCTAFWKRKRKAPNQASHATSEPAPGAGSSAHEG